MSKLARVVRFLVAASIVGAALPSQGDVFVRGYTKRDGTFVESHYRTPPNGIQSDNYSFRGNQNPRTGKVGTRSPESHSGSYGSLYGSPTSTSRTGYSLPGIPRTRPMLRGYFE